MKSIKIRNNNVIYYNCVSCGKELTEREFYMCDDLCTDCRREHYSRLDNRDYQDKNGYNKIDDILVGKFNGKGK